MDDGDQGDRVAGGRAEWYGAIMSYLSTISPLLLASGSTASLVLAEAAATDDAGRLKDVLAEVAAAQRQLSTVIEKIGHDVNSIRTSGPAPADDGLDAAIEFLLNLEQSHAPEHERILHVATTLIARARHLPPDAGKAMADIARLAANIHKAYLEALRDTRWDLMARRAATAPSPQPTNDAEGFETYLDRLLQA